MKRNSKQLTKRLIELRNAIRRKYKAFKEGSVESDIMLEKQYKPIIEELRKTTDSPVIKTETKEEFKEEEPMDYESTESENEDLPFSPPAAMSTPKPKDLSVLVNSPSAIASTTRFVQAYFKNPTTQAYMTLFMKDASNKKIIDYIYGPRYTDGTTLTVGSKKLDFDSKGNIIIGDINYGASEGLYELLFKKVPDEELYNDTDTATYKSILIATNAHRDGYTFEGKIKRNTGTKYQRIIKDLFPPAVRGKGLAWKTTKSHDIIHWDDPNELVDRLRHIAMSTETGNRVHTNEILSIIEELREAGYIKSPGNSRFKALLK